MKAIITVVIFCVVLFMYLHIYYYIKNSNDLEVYTIENPSKDGLEEICNTRQPVAFQFNNENIPSISEFKKLLKIMNKSNIQRKNCLLLPIKATLKAIKD